MIERLSDRLNRRFRTILYVSLYLRLMPYLRPYKLHMVVVVGILVLQVGVNLLAPWAWSLLVDHGLQGVPLPERLVRVLPPSAGASWYTIVVFAILFGIVMRLVGSVLDIVGEYVKTRVNEGMTLSFRAGLFDHLQRPSFSYHDQTSVGDSLYRINNGSGFISSLLWGNFRHLFMSALTLVGMVWVVFKYDWQLVFLAVSIAPII